MSTQTLTYTGSLVVTSCWCGIRLAIPDDLYNMASRKGTSVYCPIGHKFVYGDTENEQLKAAAAAAERKLANAREDARSAWANVSVAREQRDHARASAAAYKGHVTRLRNRIADGVCPVDGCRRNFANVKGHIERMHPTWAHEHPEVLA